MLRGFCFLVLLVSCVDLAQQALPAGIKPCKNDAKLNECAKKAANDVVKNLVKGDPKNRIPVLDPLLIERITVTESPGKSVALNLTLEKLNIHGLRNAEFVESAMDTAKRHIKWVFKGKVVKLLSNYEVNGKFLVVPITGKGKAVINLHEPKFSYSFDYNLEKKNGKEYVVMTKSNLFYEPKKIDIQLDNLFNGDKNLGDNVNKMFNENWKELNSSLGPSIGNAIKLVVDNLINHIIKTTPYNGVFAP